MFTKITGYTLGILTFGLLLTGLTLPHATEAATVQSQTPTTIRGNLSGAVEESKQGNENLVLILTAQNTDWSLILKDKAALNITSLVDHEVNVTGLVDANSKTIKVETITLVNNDNAFIKIEPLPNNLKYYVALCKYSDSVGEMPATPEYYNNLFNGPNKSVNNYFKTSSYDQLNVLADVSTVWFTLNNTQAYYLNQGYRTFSNDCLAKADAGVNFLNYDGLVTVSSSEYNPYWIGRATLGAEEMIFEGAIKEYRMAWIQNGYETYGKSLFLMAHELGHTLKWYHSSYSYWNQYDSEWDVMSDGRKLDLDVAHTPMDTIMLNKQKSGWLPADKIHRYTPGTAEIVKLEGSSEKPANRDADGKMVINIPIKLGDYDFDYTLELRHKVNYDTGLPGEGIFVQAIAQGQAIVLDIEGDGDVNNPSSLITPGESVFLEYSNMYVSVLSADPVAKTYTVLLSPTMPYAGFKNANGLIYNPGDRVTLSADVYNLQDPVKQVEFIHANGNYRVLGTDTTAPYALETAQTNNGQYIVQLRVTTMSGYVYYTDSITTFEIALPDNKFTYFHGDFKENTNNEFALKEFNNRLYQSYTGLDGRIYTRSSGSTDPYNPNWTAFTATVPYDYTHYAVTLEVHNGRLFQAAVGYDNRVYTRSTTDGYIWSPWNTDTKVIGEYTEHKITMASHNGRLYQAATGRDHRVYTRSSIDGVNWTYWKTDSKVIGEYTNYAISMVSNNGELQQTAVGFDNQLYIRNSTDGVNWNYWQLDLTSIARVYSDINTVVIGANQVYQTHKGIYNEIFTRVSTNNGQSYSAWKEFQMSEKTTVSIALTGYQGVLYEGAVLYEKMFVRKNISI
jgi:hypothetical protein